MTVLWPVAWPLSVGPLSNLPLSPWPLTCCNFYFLDFHHVNFPMSPWFGVFVHSHSGSTAFNAAVLNSPSLQLQCTTGSFFPFFFHSTVEVMWIFLGGKYPSIKAHLLLSVCFPSSSPPFLWGSAVGVFSALRFQRSPWLFDNTNRDLSWSWRFSVFAAW